MMAKKEKGVNKHTSTVAKYKNEEYLAEIFTMLKKMEGVILTDSNPRFNNSEMRLLGEIIQAEYEGKRLISTRLAMRLGITRSAVSQMVNKLESKGIVQRVPDEVDKKIAYIELSEQALKSYNEEKGECCDFMGEIIRRMGKENMDKLLELSSLFIDTVAELRK